MVVVLSVLIDYGKCNNRYFYLENEEVKCVSSLDDIQQNKSADHRICNIAKAINKKLSEIERVDEKIVCSVNIKIIELNDKIERRNKKLEAILFRFLRFILPKCVSDYLGISLADKIHFSVLSNLEKQALQSPINYPIFDLFTKCSEEDGERVLENTEFVQHKKFTGVIQSIVINSDLIVRSGLKPAFKIGSDACYLSKVFQAQKIENTEPPAYQLAVIAYVKDIEKNVFKPRLIYLSGADNLWRVIPIKDGLRMGKGLEVAPGRPVKASCNIPFRFGLALHWMHQQATDETLVRYTDENSELLGTIYNMLPDNTRNYFSVDPAQRSLVTRNAPGDFTRSHKLESICLTDNIKPEQYPDFTSVKKYIIPGIFSNEVNVYKFLSLDKQYEYIFYEAMSHGQENEWQDVANHPWLASVTKIDSGIDSYLTPMIACNSHGADISGSEYLSYIEKLPEGFKESLQQTIPNLHDHSLVPTWEIRKHFKIIQLFEAWKNQS